jgi:hypothetical protein
MKPIILFALLLISTFAAGQQNTEAEKVDQLHKRKFRWMVAKNYDSLDIVTDESLKFIHSNGWIQSKVEMIQDMKSEKLNYTSIVVEESSVTVHNNKSAVVTGKGTFKGLMPDKSEFSVHLLYTEVYVKSKKQWKLVSRHACKV